MLSQIQYSTEIEDDVIHDSKTTYNSLYIIEMDNLSK